MSITSFTSDINHKIIGGEKITLTWETTGESVTLNIPCFTSNGKQAAGTALDASTSVDIYPVTSCEIILSDDDNNHEYLSIIIGFDPSIYYLRGGQLHKRGK